MCQDSAVKGDVALCGDYQTRSPESAVSVEGLTGPLHGWFWSQGEGELPRVVIPASIIVVLMCDSPFPRSSDIISIDSPCW